ncbi:preprotein translocase subunit SecG [Thermosulfurimonas dismutans]|uniref:Protein-export membrane protein SecG n=1 Tax=Thermosulfurimonas dismutans TaxID=999894 RepID=A0A179D4A1_9BACT|nr:preprotein translocase subunit SecG [Thermosulfurimonas dismutans]OAQ20885.1 Preprotein translocase subunit SecG [Thermosulfurimonas dismutans]
MFTVLVVVQVILAISLIAIVLVNVGKGSEVGAVFTGSQAIFGGAGPGTFLNKVTALLAVLFFANSLLLTYLSAQKNKASIMEKAPPVVKPQPEKTLPTPPPLPVPPKTE